MGLINGLQSDREKILREIGSLYANLQRERKKGGARKNVGIAFVAEAGGRFGGNGILCLVSVIVRKDEGAGAGEGRNARGKSCWRMDRTRSHLATMLTAGKAVVKRATA